VQRATRTALAALGVEVVGNAQRVGLTSAIDRRRSAAIDVSIRRR
jgi:hypothetical protein